MSDTNIGHNFPNAHSSKPVTEGKECAKSETPKEPRSEQQQIKDVNLNENPAATVGRSQVKPAGQKPYVYDPKNTAEDIKDFQILDESLNSLAEDIAQKHNIPLEDAKLFLYEQIAQETSAA